MPHRSTLIVLSSAFVVATAACSGFELSSAPDRDEGSPTFSGATASSSSSGGGGAINANFGGGNGPESFNYTELCGTPDGCFPGSGACAAPPPGGAGGAGGGMGGAGGAAMGGAPAEGGAGPTELSCRVQVTDAAQVLSSCLPPGESGPGEPCIDSSDCGPGLGCVDTGVCRAYCCGDLEACPDETFCAPRPLAAGDVPSDLEVAPAIPVCNPVKDCSLLEDSTCPEGLTCTIVRQDGTTSCVVPGMGEAGDGCPCAPGHVCAASIDQCFQLCRLERQDACPSGYTCQGGGANYADGFGVCVQN